MTNAKAIMGAVLGALTAASAWGISALDNGSIGGNEWFGLLGVLAAAIGTYLGVYQVTNAPKTHQP
jgi:hypothetical protein